MRKLIIQADHEQTRAELAAVRTELVKVQAKAEAAEQAHSEQRKQMTERLTANQAELDEAGKAASVARTPGWPARRSPGANCRDPGTLGAG